ncbi:MAG: hypothetical protein QOH93_641 [Chloroflexia bacterium]|nr:hypothetical protein [Chloroflexia bacterium]
MSEDYILRDIQREREYQDTQWGGLEHDSQHDKEDWVRLISEYAGKALSASHPDEYRTRLVQVGALSVAAIRVHDRRVGE